MKLKTCRASIVFLLCQLCLSGCAVVAVADAVVTTTVKAGAAVAGTAIDVTRAGVRTVTGSSKDDAEPDDDSTTGPASDAAD